MSDHGQTHDAHAEHGDHAAHGGHGIAKYIYVFFSLCFLTMLSFWTFADFPVAWPYHHEPMVGRMFMLAVSSTKAMLVILFFMHVKYEANWKYVLTIPAGMMSIFLILMLIPDVGNRNRPTYLDPTVNALQAHPQPPERGGQHGPQPEKKH